MPQTQLAANVYNDLAQEIIAVYQQAKLASAQSLKKILFDAHRETGRYIVEVEQKHKLRAEQGDHLLEHLSRILLEKIGRGFSVPNLRFMRKLYIIYPKHYARSELQWTHYKLLLSIKDDSTRSFYEKQAAENKWSTRQLQKVLKRDKVQLEYFRARRRRIKESQLPAPKLSLTRGRLWTYKLITRKGKLVVDCGFNFDREVAFNGLSDPQEGQIVSLTKIDSPYAFKVSDASSKHLYTYQAFVEEVTDADSIWVYINLGLNSGLRQKLRFRGIDCPEVSTQKGKKAKEFVEALLSKVSFIVIKTHGQEKYGRWLSDIFYLEGETDPQKVLEEGIFLNQQLLDLGLAKLAEE